MAAKRRFLDVWIVESNTVYKEVPFNVVADWVQQGRLLEDDKIKPSGTAEWFRLGGMPAFAAYLPKADQYRAEDQAEALEPVNVEFAWKRPRVDCLASRLAHSAKGSWFAVGRRHAELLVKFAPCHLDPDLILGDLTLGDRPGAVVPFLPERTAGMDEQHFQFSIAPPVENQPGTLGQALRRLPHARQQTSSRRRESGP